MRPDHHILAEARELLADAEEDGLIKPGAPRAARVLDGSVYDVEWADDDAEAALARRGSKLTNGDEGK